MLQKCTRRLCGILMQRVMQSIPKKGVVPLTQLCKSLPDELLEIIALRHVSLEKLLTAHPQSATVKRVGQKETCVVHRVEYKTPETIDPVDVSVRKGAKVKKGFRADMATFPEYIRDEMVGLLKSKSTHGVGSLYGDLCSVDRRIVREYGGMLRVIRHYTEQFAVSPRGLRVALKSESNAPADEAVDDFTREEELSELAETSTSHTNGHSQEDLHYHAMCLIKYLPLHWTLAPDIFSALPIDIREKHVIAPWQVMQEYMDDFLESKNGMGCKYCVKRLKREVNIPDVGRIRTHSEMENLHCTHLAFTSIVRMQWSTPVSWRFLYIHAERETTLRLNREDFTKACLRHLGAYIIMQKNNQSFLPLPPLEIKRTPLWFQVLKNTVPKHYIPVRIVAKRLSKGALKEADASGGLIKWFNQHKNIFELTLPYAHAPAAAYQSHGESDETADTLEMDVETHAAVRRRSCTFISITQDQITETIVSALPQDGTRKPLREVLALLPVEVIDAIPLHVVPFLLDACFPQVNFDRNQTGRMFLRKGDRTCRKSPFIGTFEEKSETV
ncbi:hypothetical protein XU18_1049 [Perkinsela sp. CCAP 1560/4]|nr:hypothetical protein XU18_1049 [Perkinsela sp. CCAP 1560/4]|eukprot:KNH08480.1 hypothetical protein XU18_1049 [Perkinsela sp. CCAP 1560/4]